MISIPPPVFGPRRLEQKLPTGETIVFLEALPKEDGEPKEENKVPEPEKD